MPVAGCKMGASVQDFVKTPSFRLPIYLQQLWSSCCEWGRVHFALPWQAVTLMLVWSCQNAWKSLGLRDMISKVNQLWPLRFDGFGFDIVWPPARVAGSSGNHGWQSCSWVAESDLRITPETAQDTPCFYGTKEMHCVSLCRINVDDVYYNPAVYDAAISSLHSLHQNFAKGAWREAWRSRRGATKWETELCPSFSCPKPDTVRGWDKWSW